MRRKTAFLVCYLNRTLRYGKSKSRLLQFIVIRIRTYLKRYIRANIDFINQMGEVEIKLRRAGKMKLSTNDYIDRWLFTGDAYEPETVALIESYLERGDNFLDIGANIGYFSLIASRKIDKDGIVYAYEPTPLTIKRLETNLALNKITNVKVVEKAVSNKNEIVTFRTPCDVVRNSGRSSMRSIEENFSEFKVETVTIDSMLNQLKKIRLIKMDIEGAEGLALEGMQGLLERDRPIIIMELSDAYLRQMGYSSELVLIFLRDNNYNVYSTSDLENKIDLSVYLDKFQCDILCLPY